MKITEEKNVKIAMFFGWIEMKDYPFKGNTLYKTPDDKKCFSADNFKFNTSLDELLPVIEKLEDIYDLDFHITKIGCIVFSGSTDIVTTHGENRIDSVFHAVCNVITMIEDELI